MEEIIKMHHEEREMQQWIHNYIDEHSRDEAVDILRKCLDLSEKDNTKLAFCLENTLCGNMFGEKHDILCCIVKALGYDKEVPKKNIYSQTELCEYDPAKNGKNILKHNLSFREIVSYLDQNKAYLITYTKTKPKKEGEKCEERAVHFCAIHENENVVAICSVKTSPESSQDFDFIKKITDEIYNHNPNKSQYEYMQLIDNELKKIGFKPSKHEPLRFISARYFSSDMSESDIDSFVKEIIKDDNILNDSLEDLRNDVKDFLRKYGYFASLRV